MNPIALLGGVIAAVLGAAAWGLLTWSTGWEIGYAAWAIGGLVGFGVATLGGRGQVMAVTAALLAALSIFGGKMLAIRMVAEKELRGHVNVKEERKTYENLKRAAEDVANLTSDDEHRQLMVTYGFTEAKRAQAVSDDELAEFREESLPALKRFAEEKPDFETWKEEQSDARAQVLNDPSLIAQIAFSNLGIIDGLFMLFGIGTAFRVVVSASQSKAKPTAPAGPGDSGGIGGPGNSGGHQSEQGQPG